MSQPKLAPSPLPAAMSLQKEAFHLVIAFLADGAENNLGALVDIVTTFGTAKLQDRRLILRAIGRKYSVVMARKVHEWTNIESERDRAIEDIHLVSRRQDMETDPERVESNWLKICDIDDRINDLNEQRAEISMWFGQALIPASGLIWHRNDKGPFGGYAVCAGCDPDENPIGCPFCDYCLDDFRTKVLAPTFAKWSSLGDE